MIGFPSRTTLSPSPEGGDCRDNSDARTDRRGLLTSLTHRGVFIDAGRITDGVADGLRQEVLNAYPRPAGDRSIADAIVAHAARSDAAAPLGSLAFELLRQHLEAEHARVLRQEST